MNSSRNNATWSQLVKLKQIGFRWNKRKAWQHQCLKAINSSNLDNKIDKSLSISTLHTLNLCVMCCFQPSSID
jgi:hypothetical protein